MERILVRVEERRQDRNGLCIVLKTVDETGERNYKGFAQLPGDWADLDYNGVYLLTLQPVEFATPPKPEPEAFAQES